MCFFMFFGFLANRSCCFNFRISKALSTFKLYIFFICNPFTMFYHFLRKLPVFGEGDVLLLNCRIYTYLFYFFAYILFSKQIYTLFEDLLHPLLSSDALAKMYKITWVKRIFILKVNLPTKMLTIWTVYIVSIFVGRFTFNINILLT